MRVEAPGSHSQSVGSLPGLKRQTPEQDEINSLGTSSKVEMLRVWSLRDGEVKVGLKGACCHVALCSPAWQELLLPLPPGWRGYMGPSVLGGAEGVRAFPVRVRGRET